MNLSPLAIPFFFCPSQSVRVERELFLCKAKACLSDFDLSLLHEIMIEWESSTVLSSCFSKWKCFLPRESSVENSFHILSFNVRGLDLRIQEVLLLTSSFNFDILILLETGLMDFSFCSQVFSNFIIYYQKGENSNGGVVIMVRNNLKSERICCSIPNLCIIEIQGELEKLRTWVYMLLKVEPGNGMMFRIL
jgi:hypothetical protein